VKTVLQAQEQSLLKNISRKVSQRDLGEILAKKADKVEFDILEIKAVTKDDLEIIQKQINKAIKLNDHNISAKRILSLIFP